MRVSLSHKRSSAGQAPEAAVCMDLLAYLIRLHWELEQDGP